jgi:hypothetical protein
MNKDDISTSKMIIKKDEFLNNDEYEEKYFKSLNNNSDTFSSKDNVDTNEPSISSSHRSLPPPHHIIRGGHRFNEISVKKKNQYSSSTSQFNDFKNSRKNRYDTIMADPSMLLLNIKNSQNRNKRENNNNNNNNNDDNHHYYNDKNQNSSRSKSLSKDENNKIANIMSSQQAISSRSTRTTHNTSHRSPSLTPSNDIELSCKNNNSSSLLNPNKSSRTTPTRSSMVEFRGKSPNILRRSAFLLRRF